MKHVETTISEAAIRLRYADATDPATALEWFDFQATLSNLKSPYAEQELGEPEVRYVAEVQLAALRYARDVIGAEIQRPSSLAGRIA